MRDQRRQVEFAFGDEAKKNFHVARFSPADVADGIVAAFLLVSSVVTTGSVGTRMRKSSSFS